MFQGKHALINATLDALNAKAALVGTVVDADGFYCNAGAQYHILYHGSYADCMGVIPALKAYTGLAQTAHVA